MQKQLDFLKDKLKDSFDVKYREVDTALGPATIVFMDVLCSTQFISEYIVCLLYTSTVQAYLVTKEKGDIETAAAVGIVLIVIILALNISAKLIAKKFNKANY